MLNNYKKKPLIISKEFRHNVIKLQFLRKWRKKLRKTKYLAYKKRLSIFKTEYSSFYSICKFVYFNRIFNSKKKKNYLRFFFLKKIKSILWINNITLSYKATYLCILPKTHADLIKKWFWSILNKKSNKLNYKSKKIMFFQKISNTVSRLYILFNLLLFF